MKKTIAFALPLASTIFLFIQLSSAKPIDDSNNPVFQDVITKPVTGLPHHEIDFTVPNDSDFKMPDSVKTVAHDVNKISGDFHSDKSSPSISHPISGDIESASLHAGYEKPSRLPFTNMEPSGSENSANSVSNLKTDSWTTGNPMTTSEPVPEREEAISSVAALESDTEDPDNLLTILEPDSSSSTVNSAFGEPAGSIPTNLESDSGRRENSATTFIPDSHHRGDKLTNLPVTSANKNGASNIGSPCMMMLLGMFLVAGSQVT